MRKRIKPTVKPEADKALEGIPRAKIGKKGFAIQMSKRTELEMSQKMKKQDSMFR